MKRPFRRDSVYLMGQYGWPVFREFVITLLLLVSRTKIRFSSNFTFEREPAVSLTALMLKQQSL
jgi:hypothetical protein